MFDLRQFAAIAPDIYQRLHYHEQLGSTNDEAHLLADAGAEHGTVVLAEHQTQGRGRRGTEWLSDSGEGLLFSVILRPRFSKDKWSRIALATGLGIVTALNETWNVKAQIKWPNDIYLRDRKCAGILTEAKGDYIVVGVGLNVMSSPKTDDLRTEGIALMDVISFSGSREKVLAVALAGILKEVESCDASFESQRARLRTVFYLTGKNVRFTSGQQQYSGQVEGVSPDGSLLVDISGHIKSFSQAFEIRIV